MDNMKLSPPWVTWFRELKALFSGDRQVKAVFDQEDMFIHVYVDNAAKAYALTAILPTGKVFGNVTVKVAVIPSNKPGDSYVDDMKTAFDGNDALVGIKTVTSPLGSFTYAVWEREIVQFFDDNLADPHGLRTMLYEQIARDVLKDDLGIFHCTEEGLLAPLGEWP